MRRLFGGPFFSSRPTESTLKDQKSISIAVFFQSERREDNLKEETLTDFTTGDLSLLWGWSVSGVGHYEAPIDLTGNTLLGGKKKKKRRSFAGRGVFHTQRAEFFIFSIINYRQARARAIECFTKEAREMCSWPFWKSG